MSAPTHFVAALIMSASNGMLIGHVAIATDIDPEPANLAEVKQLARRCTLRAHHDGDLPEGQYYSVISWQRFGAGATGAES